MLVRKKPTIAEKRVAATQAKGRRSRGPATPEGRERIRDAHTDHRSYSQVEGVALRARGEKAEDFDAMVKGLKGPSPFEPAAEIVLAHPGAALMQRMEESNFRQIWRITTLLLKIKNQARGEQSREMAARSRDVYERKAS